MSASSADYVVYRLQLRFTHACSVLIGLYFGYLADTPYLVCMSAESIGFGSADADGDTHIRYSGNSNICARMYILRGYDRPSKYHKAAKV